MRLRKCGACGTYTIKSVCNRCNIDSKPVGPARYSPEDPYGKYRRMMKRQMSEVAHNG